MKAAILLALAMLAATATAQIPTGATPITIRQVNTLAGITTWTFTDSAGKLYYIQSSAYVIVQIPGGPTVNSPVPSPGVWVLEGSTTPPAAGSPSPDKTTILNNDGKAIIDAQNNRWTVQNGQVLENAQLIGYTSGVAKLVIVKGVLWQENTANNWYYWNTTDKAWDGGAAPI